MDVPLEISCPDFEMTDTIRTLVHDLSGELERLCDHITSCRVTIEMPQKHQEAGNPLEVRVETHIPPRHHLVVKRHTGEMEMHADLVTVLNDAFAAMERQVKKIDDIQRGEVKSHPQQEANAFVTKLLPEQECGFLESTGGQEVYFHRHSVVNDEYDRLSVGTGVHYVEASGTNGPQASTVKIVNKPGVRPHPSE